MDIRGEHAGMRFKFLGVKLHISVPFCIMLAFLLIIDKTGLMTASIFAMTVHELGHIFMMRKLKCLPREVCFGFGGITIVGSGFCTFKESTEIALAGPLANFIMFVLFYGLGLILNDSFMLVFAIVQLLEGAVNLFPVKGLDGGTVMTIAVNSLRIKYKRFIVNAISTVTAFAIFIGGMAVAVKNVSNPSLLLLGIYLIILNVCRRD